MNAIYVTIFADVRAFCDVINRRCDAPTAEANCTECIQRALTYDPNHPQALQTLASIYISTHKNAEALALMQRAVALWHVKVEDVEAAAGSVTTLSLPLSPLPLSPS